MNYAWIDKSRNVIWFEEIPDTFKQVSGFNLLSEAERLSYDFYPVVRNKPELDKRIQRQTGPEIVIGTSEITATWQNVDLPLSSIKAQQIAKLKDVTETIVLNKVPLWKQHNCVIPGRLSHEQVQEIHTFIDACRDACNIAEKSILTATIGTEVISIMDAHIAILNSLIVPTI